MADFRITQIHPPHRRRRSFSDLVRISSWYFHIIFSCARYFVVARRTHEFVVGDFIVEEVINRAQNVKQNVIRLIHVVGLCSSNTQRVSPFVFQNILAASSTSRLVCGISAVWICTNWCNGVARFPYVPQHPLRILSIFCAFVEHSNRINLTGTTITVCSQGETNIKPNTWKNDYVNFVGLHYRMERVRGRARAN